MESGTTSVNVTTNGVTYDEVDSSVFPHLDNATIRAHAPVDLAVELGAIEIEDDESTELDLVLREVPDANLSSLSIALDVDEEVASIADVSAAHENASAELNATGEASVVTWSGANATLNESATDVTLATVTVDGESEGDATIDATVEGATATNASVVGVLANASLDLAVESSGGGGGGLPALPGGGGSSGGGSGIGGDEDERGSEDEQGSEDEAEAQPEFALSLDSTVGSVVLEGEHASAGETASEDVDAGLGALALTGVEADAGSAAESFELAIGADASEQPDVDGEVVETLSVADEGVLASATLSLAVDDAALPDDASADDLTVYVRDGAEWSEAGSVAASGEFEATVEGEGALAVVAPASEDEPEDDDSDDDGSPGFGVGAAIVALLAAAAASVRRTA